MVVPNLNFLRPYPIYNLMVHRHRTTASSSLSSLLQPYPIRTLHHAPRPTLTLGPGSVEEERRQPGRPTGPRPRRDAQSSASLDGRAQARRRRSQRLRLRADGRTSVFSKRSCTHAGGKLARARGFE